MNRLNNLLTLRFYDEPDSSTGGESTGEPLKSAPAAHNEPSPRLRPKPTNARDFLDKSKLVKTEGETADGSNVVIPGGQTAPAEPGNAPKPGEGEKNEPDEILIAGPGTKTQQPGSEPGKPVNPDEPKGEGVDGLGVVKIGEVEYTVDQIKSGQEALTTREKDDENRKTWQGNLTKKSQLVSAMTDQQLEEVLPYATSQRKLPENFKEELAKVELPETITTTDSDGYETVVKTADLPEEYLDKLANAVLMQKWPEYAEAIKENEQLKADNEKITSSVTQEQYSRGVEMSVNFMKDHPDTAITLRKGDDLKEVLAGIIKAGDDHPEYENAVRYGVILKAVSDGFMPDMETAYSIMGSGNSIKANAASQVMKNQGETPATEKPGSKKPALDPGREFLAKKRSVKGTKIMKLGRI